MRKNHRAATDTAPEQEAVTFVDPYAPDARTCVILPGSNGTVSGTAVNDWIDAYGNSVDPATGKPPLRATSRL
ncbi:hypothetical protein [Antrihabitans sp. YC2-6]|uniref:hypothetical protein n=1 Tax=Antrihabitans sp. YC2-6 TaxID=2799498 RepID=UPI0018F3ECC7|nr:hypothetical protein [Antrihabitans sp. YC2-6]MBJ8348394.1 hypothetical protein [Antrihabitans sp. YC2-6]